MTVRFYADGLRCAIYDEAPGGGDPVDPNSLMNRPIVDPTGWVNNLYFHSDLNYYGVVNYASANISHAAVPGITRTIGAGGSTSSIVTIVGQIIRTNHNLVTHGLGYVPRFFCIYDGKLVPHGTPVQVQSTNRIRFVSAYATDTEIRLMEMGVSDSTALSATTRTYQVIVFRDPAASPTTKELDIYPGGADFGRGKFRGSEPHLRADGAGDIQWPIATSRTAAIRNGGLRAYVPDGSYVDFQGFNGTLAPPSYITTSAGV